MIKSPQDLINSYHKADTWYEKALIIKIYHTLMCGIFSDWTLRKTAKKLDRSVGLVSEDLRLANACQADEKMLQATSRMAALVLLKDYENVE